MIRCYLEGERSAGNYLLVIMFISWGTGSRGKIWAGSFTSWGKVTQWPVDPIPPCLRRWTFIQGEIVDISCCSTTVRSINSGGSFLGFIIFSLENILIVELSAWQRWQWHTPVFGCPDDMAHDPNGPDDTDCGYGRYGPVRYLYA